MQTPEVSVVVLAGDGPRLLRAALDSVFAQTFRRFEVIVVDAGSRDDVETAVADWSDSIRHICHSDADGAVDAGAHQARGRFLAFLAAHDLWMPRKLQCQVEYFTRFPAAALVDAALIASRRPVSMIHDSADPAAVESAPPPAILSSDGGVRRRIDLSTVMVRRDVFEEVRRLDESRCGARRDADLWQRIASIHPFGHIAAPLTVIRAEGSATAPAADPRNLVHDTIYGRARRKAVEWLHRADDAATRALRSDRAHVLFEAASPLSLAVFRPVLDRVRIDPRIDVWFTTADGSWRPHQIFQETEFADRVIGPAAARLMKFDAYVNTDFWSMTWLPRRARRVHLFHGVAGKYGLDAPVRIAPVVASFDRVLFPNVDRLRNYEEAGLVDPDGDQAALVGYPKVDCLVNGTLDRAAIERGLGLDATRPTVVYAPTWSPYSSLQTEGIEAIRRLGSLGVNVIVKLHDRSYDPATRGSGGINWRESLVRLGRECPVHIAAKADASPYLFVSDALVTDHSSVGFEFMLLDRPVVVIACPQLIEKARVSSAKVKLLRSASTLVESGAAVADAVARELAAPARLSSERRRVGALLFYGAGRAAERATRCLYDVLGLRTPRAEPYAVRLDQIVLGPAYSAPTLGAAAFASDSKEAKP